MDRQSALEYLNASGYDVVMVDLERVTNDTPAGYLSVLDRAYSLYVSSRSLPTDLYETVVAPADVNGFYQLLDACAYDLITRSYARMVDTYVDAPLAHAKFSQAFRQYQELRKEAWKEAAIYGYGNDATAGGFVINLDFVEPTPVDMFK